MLGRRIIAFPRARGFLFPVLGIVIVSKRPRNAIGRVIIGRGSSDLVLRRDLEDEVEFVVLNLFATLDAVRAFAGDGYEVPVFEPTARHEELRLRT